MIKQDQPGFNFYVKGEYHQGGFILLRKVKEEQIVVDNGCFLSNPQIIYFVPLYNENLQRML